MQFIQIIPSSAEKPVNCIKKHNNKPMFLYKSEYQIKTKEYREQRTELIGTRRMK
jgi:hypothetical protein